MLSGKFQKAATISYGVLRATHRCQERKKPSTGGHGLTPWLSSHPPPYSPTLPPRPWAGSACSFSLRKDAEAQRGRMVAWLTVWTWLALEPGLRHPGPGIPPPDAPGGGPTVAGPRQPREGRAAPLLAPPLLTQHAHCVQPGVLPGRVVGHAGVGARVLGPQALQHQGTAVHVEPARGRRAESRHVRGCGCCSGWGRGDPGGHGAGLTGGGGPRLGPAGHRPSARPRRAGAARPPHSAAAPPAPLGHCAPAWHPSSGSGGPLRRGLW